jgi:hypothetical protein
MRAHQGWIFFAPNEQVFNEIFQLRQRLSLACIQPRAEAAHERELVARSKLYKNESVVQSRHEENEAKYVMNHLWTDWAMNHQPSTCRLQSMVACPCSCRNLFRKTFSIFPLGVSFAQPHTTRVVHA